MSLSNSLQAQSLCQIALLPQHWHGTVQFAMGVLLFVLGAALNMISDATLRRLRAAHPHQYSIPYGGMFYWVSCPHYLGELLEWTGFCIACNFSLASTAFALYTAANLIPRGVAHHEWYRQTFAARYPAHRKAVIPFLW
jgi:3-oxo-5-alpha-steroid 4-dehydrogenase 1